MATKNPPKKAPRAGAGETKKAPGKSKMTAAQLEASKRLAFVLYTENGLDQQVIADITGISKNSISRWKIEGNWDDEREQLRIGPEKEMRRIRKMINEQLDRIEARTDNPFPEPAEGDTINKLADAIKKLRGEALTSADRSRVGKEFINHVQKRYGQEKAIDILNIWHEYIMENA